MDELRTPSGPQTRIITKGDTFTKLAHQYGLTAAELALANPGMNQFRLKLGQELVIPEAGSFSEQDVMKMGKGLDGQYQTRLAAQRMAAQKAQAAGSMSLESQIKQKLWGGIGDNATDVALAVMSLMTGGPRATPTKINSQPVFNINDGPGRAYDLLKVPVNTALNVTEGFLNLPSGALPGGSDYYPILEPFRLPYSDAKFGQMMEIGLGIAAGGLGARGGARGVSVPNSALRQTGGGSAVDQADALYDVIRKSNTDVEVIAATTGIKPLNIQKVKDHVFYNEHLLDKYVDYGIPAVRARFDSDINQALAWQRLESGTFTKQDTTWMKHEIAERWYELRHSSGYTKAHNAAEKKWTGNPWE
ncbi:LysM domain-containing protein [Neisseriaceae bacterium TC5R-5]|nr:LysM domain-containing protein [Neisseriaceae bacterium TC5R-5]